MCTRFTNKGEEFKNGKRIPAKFFKGYPPSNPTWIAFATVEKLLNYWLTLPHHHLVEIPADTFAERTDTTKELVWADMPKDGSTLFGILEPEVQNKDYQPVRIITRAADTEELEYFDHGRVPLVGKLTGEKSWEQTKEKFGFHQSPRQRQGELFV